MTHREPWRVSTKNGLDSATIPGWKKSTGARSTAGTRRRLSSSTRESGAKRASIWISSWRSSRSTRLRGRWPGRLEISGPWQQRQRIGTSVAGHLEIAAGLEVPTPGAIQLAVILVHLHTTIWAGSLDRLRIRCSRVFCIHSQPSTSVGDRSAADRTTPAKISTPESAIVHVRASPRIGTARKATSTGCRQM